MYTASPSQLTDHRQDTKTTGFDGRTLINRYATAATIATFAIVAVSGVALFFHFGESYLMGLHEWIGMAFVVAAAFHVVRHVRPFTKHLTKSHAHATFALAALVTAGFIGAATFGSSDVDPRRQLIQSSLNAPISALSQVVGTSSVEILSRFEKAGFSGISANQSVNEIAIAQGTEPRRLLRVALSASTPQ